MKRDRPRDTGVAIQVGIFSMVYLGALAVRLPTMRGTELRLEILFGAIVVVFLAVCVFRLIVPPQSRLGRCIFSSVDVLLLLSIMGGLAVYVHGRCNGPEGLSASEKAGNFAVLGFGGIVLLFAVRKLISCCRGRQEEPCLPVDADTRGDTDE